MKKPKGYLAQLAPPCHVTASTYFDDVLSSHPDVAAPDIHISSVVGTCDRCGSRWSVRAVSARIDDIYTDTYHWELLSV